MNLLGNTSSASEDSQLSAKDSAGYRNTVSFDFTALGELRQQIDANTYLNGSTNASRTLATTYDKLGNIDTKTSSVTADVNVTDYGYGSGTAAPGHHAVTSASIGGNAHTFSFDADGNMTQYDCTPATCEDKYIGWNKRNLPTTVTLGDSLADTTPTAKDEFAYGPNGQRYYKKSTWDDAGALRTEHTFYVGRFEEVLPGDQPDYSSIQKTRVTDSLLHVRTTSADGMTVVSAMEYLHRDHLGSVEAVTDAGGASLLVQAYDPFGERRKSDWMGMLSASERQTLADNQPLKTSRGYTGHEHLDRTGFIHMNGRLYDPQLGRFLSPDPIVAAPGSSQSWNSYSYVSNSPLSYVDPGGQFQAGIGCNVGYVMCMNGGGNTSGRGGGGSSQGTETVPIRTFNFHIGVIFARVPVLRDPIGSVFGRGGGINDDPNGGINSDVYFGGLLSVSFRVISNFFISITSNTEMRQIQTTEEEQSPASRPMGAGAQQNQYAITDAERQLVADGNIQGFWESRLAAGDPIARAGLASLNPPGGAVDYLFGGTSINKRLQAFANVYADGVLNVDQVRSELANAHIRFTDNDTSGIRGLLNPSQIAEYHHNVFRDHNLPPTAFGGTPFTGAVGEANFTRPFWCGGCDTR